MMDPNDLPATIPNPERLSTMLSEVGTSFRSTEAYEAAQTAGYDETKRTLRNDLNAAAEAGILERVGSGAWKKAEEDRTELRTRIGLALLSAGEWSRMAMSGDHSYEGPTPEELEDYIHRYEDVFRAF